MYCLCFVFLRFVNPMLPVSLDCPFCIAPWVFSNVYIMIFFLLLSKIADSFLTNLSNVVKHIFKANIFSNLYLDRFISYIMLMAWESRKIRKKFAFLPVSNFYVIYVFHLNGKMFICFNIQVPCIVTKYWYISSISV